MLSKNLLKLIHSLELKKNRKETNLFVAEGEKLVKDLLSSGLKCTNIILTERHIQQFKHFKSIEITVVNDSELKKASFLRAPQGIIGIFKQKETKYTNNIPQHELCLALDEVQDPGNLGTIIRIADWFGFSNIFCSKGTVDIYNPKTVQATMGAIARVNVHYVDLPNFIKEQNKNVPIYGTFLEGENIYKHKLSSNGIIIMGNEGNGIGEACEKYITERIFIPNYPIGIPTSESLNVSTATAIVCSEFRRRM